MWDCILERAWETAFRRGPGNAAILLLLSLTLTESSVANKQWICIALLLHPSRIPVAARKEQEQGDSGCSFPWWPGPIAWGQRIVLPAASQALCIILGVSPVWVECGNRAGISTTTKFTTLSRAKKFWKASCSISTLSVIGNLSKCVAGPFQGWEEKYYLQNLCKS